MALIGVLKETDEAPVFLLWPNSLLLADFETK
jgi:hypothetical protein